MTSMHTTISVDNQQHVDALAKSFAAAMKLRKLVLAVEENDFGNSVIGDPLKAAMSECFVIRVGQGRTSKRWERASTRNFLVALGMAADIASFEQALKSGEYTVVVLEVFDVSPDHYGFLSEVRSEIEGTANEIGSFIRSINAKCCFMSTEEAQRLHEQGLPPPPSDAAIPAHSSKDGRPTRRGLTEVRYALSDSDDDSELPASEDVSELPTSATTRKKRRGPPLPGPGSKKSRAAPVDASPPSPAPAPAKVNVNRMTAPSRTQPDGSGERARHLGSPELGSVLFSDDAAARPDMNNGQNAPRTPPNPPAPPHLPPKRVYRSSGHGHGRHRADIPKGSKGILGDELTLTRPVRKSPEHGDVEGGGGGKKRKVLNLERSTGNYAEILEGKIRRLLEAKQEIYSGTKQGYISATQRFDGVKAAQYLKHVLGYEPSERTVRNALSFAKIQLARESDLAE